VLDQTLREPLEPGEAHEGDERPGRARECRSVEALDVVRGERRHRRRDAAVRDGDAGGAGNGRERRDAGNDLERYARLDERERLLAAATEEERVPAFEPDDVVAKPAVGDEQRVHLFLLEAVALDPQRIGGRLVDELASDESVVHDDVARAHALETLDRDQTRVARAGAYQGDAHLAGVGVGVGRIDWSFPTDDGAKPRRPGCSAPQAAPRALVTALRK